ncbi:coiled-coil-helix-coiled-coil-helix domain-containing protein 10, mitochondrial [Drosophila subpulchrella]|uniref:coiled-coil-helix-coiled-coil-helix domain-containing protein 10, mitochondrial n=1 Tax=Drosophila subpulchrella TaxID=1486046 RepID=UPI0018A16383|nr:coiled-coil-helix-coiled-coil-helix domain-containing protein 10, mitochondrial [Drosophila subpulchrella]
MPRRQRSASAKPSSMCNLPVVLPTTRSSEMILRDVAAQAAGVAAGSAVGHAIGAGITGLFRGRGQQPHHSDLVEEGPCAREMKQFLKCTEENRDLNVCKVFRDAVRRCHRLYNI